MWFYLICKFLEVWNSSFSVLNRSHLKDMENLLEVGDLRVEIFLFSAMTYRQIDESFRLSSAFVEGIYPFLRWYKVHLLSVRRSCLQVFGRVTGSFALQLVYSSYCRCVIVLQLLSHS